MTKTVKALVITAEGRGAVLDVPPDLDTLKGIVDGWLEHVSTGKDWHLYCDEEGKLKARLANRVATLLAWNLGWPTRDILVGNVVFLGHNLEDSAEEGDVPERVIEVWRDIVEES